jgi:hypothetical protein
MRVRYSGGRPIVVTGPATGVDYHFSGIARVQLVDPRDAIALARNDSFRIEGVIELHTIGMASPITAEGDHA